MSYFQPNPGRRSSTRGLMGPTVLVTVGLLFLLANMPNFPFQRTWPILLIVIGAVQVVRYARPERGEWNPGLYPPAPDHRPYVGQYPSPAPYPPPSPQAPPQPEAPRNGAQNGAPASELLVTPPPAPMAGVLDDGEGEKSEFHNG